MCRGVQECWRQADNRELPALCPCGGAAVKVPSVPGGLVGSVTETAPRPIDGTTTRQPNIIMRNCSATEISESVIDIAGIHADIDGLGVTKSPVAVRLREGATVSARNVVHQP